MKDEFSSWWHNGEAQNNNPYELDSAAYWAWEGWCAGVAAEREACAKVCCEHWLNGGNAMECADAIKERDKK